VYLSLGSNLGDRVGNLRWAVQDLSGDLEDLRVSSLYETEPLYLRQQPRFLNIVAAGRCRLSPQALLERIHGIEARLAETEAARCPRGRARSTSTSSCTGS
jgi:2-amino-4-hydroxy-6-hydroxymethyldihydropteridine diphosphokinase